MFSENNTVSTHDTNNSKFSQVCFNQLISVLLFSLLAAKYTRNRRLIHTGKKKQKSKPAIWRWWGIRSARRLPTRSRDENRVSFHSRKQAGMILMIGWYSSRDRDNAESYLHQLTNTQPSNTPSPSSSIADNLPVRDETAPPSRTQTAPDLRRVQKSSKRLVVRDDLTLLSSKRIMKERFELLKSIIDVRMLRGERPLYDSEIPKDMLALLTNPAEAHL